MNSPVSRELALAVGTPAYGYYQLPANRYTTIASQVATQQQQVNHYMEGFKAGQAAGFAAASNTWQRRVRDAKSQTSKFPEQLEKYANSMDAKTLVKKRKSFFNLLINSS